MEGSNNNISKPTCPCCVFMNHQDLFLPPPSLEDNDTIRGDQKKGEEEEDGVVVSPIEALKCLQDHARKLLQREDEAATIKAPLLLVDTHNHAHLKRERHASYITDLDSSSSDDGPVLSLVSLTLAVEESDWEDALQYAATSVAENSHQQEQQQSHHTLMGLGIHPWYLEGVDPDDGSDWMAKLATLLQQHPSAIVGEIGLCKMAKCARSHPEGKTRGFEMQRQVLHQQFKLAIQYQRPVSIHCVQQHGVLLELLQEISIRAKEQIKTVQQQQQQQQQRDNETEANTTTSISQFVPPAIALHSFTGTAHHVKTLLQWEATLFGEGPNDRKKKKKHTSQKDDDNKDTATSSTEGENENQPPKRKPLLYFGFSHIVNYEMCTSDKARRQGLEAVRAVPLDRLLAESDVHNPLDVPAGTAGAIAYMAHALQRSIPFVAERTAVNGLLFLQSHLNTS